MAETQQNHALHGSCLARERFVEKLGSNFLH